VQAFKKGFNSIFPITSLQPFTSTYEDEVDKIVCGSKCNSADWESAVSLEKLIKPDHGFNSSSS